MLTSRFPLDDIVLLEILSNSSVSAAFNAAAALSGNSSQKKVTP